jgi:hypothetical protein
MWNKERTRSYEEKDRSNCSEPVCAKEMLRLRKMMRVGTIIRLMNSSSHTNLGCLVRSVTHSCEHYSYNLRQLLRLHF